MYDLFNMLAEGPSIIYNQTTSPMFDGVISVSPSEIMKLNVGVFCVNYALKLNCVGPHVVFLKTPDSFF